MASAKLSGSLLIYRELPSALQAQRQAASPNEPSVDLIAADTAVAGDTPSEVGDDAMLGEAMAAGLASVPARADRGFGPIIRVGLVGWALAATAAAVFFVLVNMSGQTGATITAQKDRVVPSPASEAMSSMRSPESANARASDTPAATISASAEPIPSSTPVVSVPGSPAPPVDPTPPAVRLPADEVAALIGRGDTLLGNGDIASARLFYERAADGGDAQAALRLGETYDVAFLAHVGLGGVRGDPAAAARWYRRASRLGAAEAEILLSALGAGSGEK